jgi:predicted site-specific integrase-resolvase
MLLATWRAVAQWPEDWHATLHRIASQEMRLGPASQWRLGSFPASLKLWFPEQEFAFLREAWATFVPQPNGGEQMSYRWILEVYQAERERATGATNATQPRRMMTQSEAAAYLGVRVGLVRGYLRDGQLRLTAEIAGATFLRGHKRLLDATSVRALEKRLASAMTTGEAAYLLRAPEAYVRALAKARLLVGTSTTGPNGDQIWTFKKEALDSVMREYVGTLPLRQVSSSVRTTISIFQASRQLQGVGLGPADVLRAIRSGRLTAYRTSTSCMFKAVRMYTAEVKAYKAELRSAQLVSYEQAQRLLHCKSGALRYLEVAGHLTPRLIERRDRGTWRWYAREDIDDFKHQYISAKQAATIIGCSVERVCYWARQGRITPVGGPHTDKWSRYWFDREQLVASRHRLLRSCEAQELLQVSPATIFRWVQQGILTRREGLFGGRRSWFEREQVEALGRSENSRSE